MYTKTFSNLREGLRALADISESVADSIGALLRPSDRSFEAGEDDEEFEPRAVAALAQQAVYRPTGNTAGWNGGLSLTVGPFGATYRTSGLVEFSWRRVPPYDEAGNAQEPGWVIGCEPPPLSRGSLAAALETAGWQPA